MDGDKVLLLEYPLAVCGIAGFLFQADGQVVLVLKHGRQGEAGIQITAAVREGFAQAIKPVLAAGFPIHKIGVIVAKIIAGKINHIAFDHPIPVESLPLGHIIRREAQFLPGGDHVGLIQIVGEGNLIAGCVIAFRQFSESVPFLHRDGALAESRLRRVGKGGCQECHDDQYAEDTEKLFVFHDNFLQGSKIRLGTSKLIAVHIY